MPRDIPGQLAMFGGLPPLAPSPSEEAREEAARRGRLQTAVYEAMRDGSWLTIDEVMARAARWLEAAHPGERNASSATGTSARIRNLRKPEYGGHRVLTRRRRGAGNLYEYRLAL